MEVIYVIVVTLFRIATDLIVSIVTFFTVPLGWAALAIWGVSFVVLLRKEIRQWWAERGRQRLARLTGRR